jgi:hypothetical protein
MQWGLHDPSLDILLVIQKHTDVQAEFFSMITYSIRRDGGLVLQAEQKYYPICLFHYHSEGEECWASTYTFANYPVQQ